MFQKCVEFCLLKLFQYTAFASPYKAWTRINTLRCTKTLHTSIPLWETPQRPSPHLQSTWETNRHHQTQKDTKKRHLSGHTSSNSLFGCLGTSVGVAWCLLVSVVVLNCPEITGVGFWEHNNGVYVCLWCLDASKGCIWVFRPCMVKQMLYIGKAKFHTLGTFETSKYQNRPI